MFLNSFSYFRAIGILLVVAGHCLGFIWPTYPDSFAKKLVLNLVEGGTANFVFISGFLFHHVFARNFDFRRFLGKKVSGVLVPYLVMSLLPISYYVFVERTGPYRDFFFLPGNGLYLEYLRPFALYLVTGRTFVAYWYVPFIMVIFLMSPLFMRFIRFPLAAKIGVMAPLFLVSMLIHRPVNNLSVLQSVLYFTPVYLLGITVSLHRESVYRFCRGREFFFLGAALSLSLFQVSSFHTFSNFHKDPFVITVLDINLVEKCLMSLFYFVWLHRFESVELPLLKRISEGSFAIFFLHPLVLDAFQVIVYGGHHLTRFSRHLYSILLYPAVLAICLVVAVSAKTVLRDKSRLVIGW